MNIADHTDYTLTPTQSYTWSGWVKNNNFNQWSTVWSQTINTSNFFYFYAHTTTDQDGGPVTNISDFAPNNSNVGVRAVPEPGSLAMHPATRTPFFWKLK